MPKLIQQEVTPMKLGKVIHGSQRMMPHMIQRIPDTRAAMTRGNGMDLAFFVRTTVGNVIMDEHDCTTEHVDEMRPEKKSARSRGRTNIAPTWRSTSTDTIR